MGSSGRLLMKLFDAVAIAHREILPAREAVDEIDRLRCTWIAREVSTWPVDLKRLRTISLDSVRVIKRLEPGVTPILQLEGD